MLRKYAKNITGRFKVRKRDDGLMIVSQFWNSNMIKLMAQEDSC